MGFKRRSCGKCTAFTLLILGIPLLIAGIIVAALGSFKSLAEDEIKKSLPLKTGSKSFQNWEKPKGELFKIYYLFNVTNTNVANGSIPKIKQLGPYSYRENTFYNVTKRDGQTITYIPNTKYYFDRARSCKNCDPIIDKIVTINYPLLVILRRISVGLKDNPPQAMIKIREISYLLKVLNIGLFQIRSVHELLWGYKDPALSKFIDQLPNNTKDKDEVYALQFNNSGTGIAKIYSGEDDVNRVAEYLEWRNFTKLPWWNSDTANSINGTDARRFKPSVDKEDVLYVLVPEICRSVKLTYDSTVKLYDIELYRYTIREEAFESGDVNPDKKGFCVTGPDKKCLLSGLLDINGCKGGPQKAPPLVASPPLFYLGVPQLSKIFNLVPQKKLHATFIDVEPNTGITMQGHKRLQLNLAITNFSITSLLLNVNTSKPIFFPVFFTDKSAVISESDAENFKKKVIFPLRATEAVPYVLIALGVLFILIALVIAFCLHKKSRHHEAIHNEDL